MIHNNSNLSVMEILMVQRIHQRFQDTHIKSAGFYRILKLAVDGLNLLVRVGLVLLAMWVIASA